MFHSTLDPVSADFAIKRGYDGSNAEQAWSIDSYQTGGGFLGFDFNPRMLE
jgi:hypothetical protein